MPQPRRLPRSARAQSVHRRPCRDKAHAPASAFNHRYVIFAGGLAHAQRHLVRRTNQHGRHRHVGRAIVQGDRNVRRIDDHKGRVLDARKHTRIRLRCNNWGPRATGSPSLSFSSRRSSAKLMRSLRSLAPPTANSAIAKSNPTATAANTTCVAPSQAICAVPCDGSATVAALASRRSVGAIASNARTNATIARARAARLRAKACV